MLVDIRLINEIKMDRYIEDGDFYITFQKCEGKKEGETYLNTHLNYNQHLTTMEKSWLGDTIQCQLSMNIPSIDLTEEDYILFTCLRASKFLSRLHQGVYAGKPLIESLDIKRIVIYISLTNLVKNDHELIEKLSGELYRIVYFMNDYRAREDSQIYFASPFTMFAEIPETELEQARSWYEQVIIRDYLEVPNEIYSIIFRAKLLLEEKIPSVMSKLEPVKYWTRGPVSKNHVIKKKKKIFAEIKLPVIRSLKERKDNVMIGGLKTVSAR